MLTLRQQKLPLWLILSLPALLGVWTYWPSLQLPLVYDTLLHTQIADDLNWMSVWRPSQNFGFYRPLVFLPMIAIRTLIGGYPAVLMHALNVGQHAINTVLLTLLIYRWLDRRWEALLGGLFFAAFPFAYQALAIYGNNAYLTVTGLVLAATLVYTSSVSGKRLRPSRRVQIITICLFVIAALVHELAALLIPIIGLWMLVSRPRLFARLPGLWRYHLPLFGVWLIYLLIYTQLPTGGGPLLDYGGNDLQIKLMLFAQTLAYPFTWFAHVWPHLSAATVIWGGFVLSVGLIVPAAFFSYPQRQLLLFGLGWWLGATLLVGVTLPTYYIADGARLLYFGAPGLALCWAAGLTAVWELGNSYTRAVAWPIRCVSLALGAWLIFSGASFARSMIGLYHLASDPIHQIDRKLTDLLVTDKDGLILVNVPQWVSAERNTYALGTEFAPVLGEHLFAYEMVKVNFWQERPIYTLVRPELLADTTYNYGLYTFLSESNLVDVLEPDVNHVFIHRYAQPAEEGISAEYTGFLTRPFTRDNLLADKSRFPQQIGGYTVLDGKANQCVPGMIDVLLVLEVDPSIDMPPTHSFFVQALSSDGALVAQLDRPPLGLPPDILPQRAILVDVRQLSLEPGQSAEQIMFGGYNYLNGERFEAADVNGRLTEDRALRLDVGRDGCE